MSKWTWRRPDLSGRLAATLRALDPAPAPAVDLLSAMLRDDDARGVGRDTPAAVDSWGAFPLFPAWVDDWYPDGHGSLFA